MSETNEKERDVVTKIDSERYFNMEDALRAIANVKIIAAGQSDFWRLLAVIDIAKKALESQ